MKAFLTWLEKDKVQRKLVDARVTEFKMNTGASWRLVVSDEKKTLRKNKPELLKIQKIDLPERTLAKPLSIMRHPSAIIVGLAEYGIPTLVERAKTIDRVLVYPISDFEVEAGDLIGVFEVQYVETGLFKSLKKREISEKVLNEANMVFEKDGSISRKKIVASSLDYKMSQFAYWTPIVSDEEKAVQKGKPARIRVREIKLPINTVVKPLYGLNHAIGTVIGLIGDVELVERPRKIREVVFIPTQDGSVERGDLLGALNVYYIATKQMVVQLQEEDFQSINVTFMENGEVKRRAIKTKSVGYLRTFSGYWVPIVSEEELEVKAGEIVSVKVRDIFIPEYTVVSPIHTPTHALGCVLDLRTDKPRKIEEKKSVSEIIFLPVMDGKIEKNDLLGSLSVHEVYFTWTLTLFPEVPKERLEEVRRRFLAFSE